MNRFSGSRAPALAGFGAVTAVSFAVFLATLCPTVAPGDSGELALGAWCLGVTHPPGYPLFVLLGRLAVAVLPGEPALATNFLSALCASLAAGLLFLVAREAGVKGAAAFAASLALAFSPTYWSQATVTEVYSSLCLLFVVLLWLAVRADRERRSLYAAAYLCGLALTTHQSIALTLPAMAMFLAAKKPRTLPALLLFIMGASLYLYIPLRSALGPALNWAEGMHWTDLGAFLLRKTYGPLRQNQLGPALFLADMQAFFSLLLREFPLPVLILAPLGIARLAAARRAFTLLSAALFFSFPLGMILLIAPYPDSVHMHQLSYLYLPAYVIAALWLGAGLEAVLDRVIAAAGGVGWARGVALALPLYLFACGYQSADRSSSFAARAYGEDILRTLPLRAVLVVDGDNESFITAYLVRCLGMRPDVRVFHRRGYVFPAPFYIKRSSRGDLAANSRRWQREILSAGEPVYYSSYADLSPFGFRLEREGILFRAWRIDAGGGNPPTGRSYQAPLQAVHRARSAPVGRGWERARILIASYDTDLLDADPRHLDFLTRKIALAYLQARREYLLGHGDTDGAARTLDLMGRMGYDVSQVQYLIGVDRERGGRLEEARVRFLQAARLDPKAPLPWRALVRVNGKLSRCRSSY